MDEKSLFTQFWTAESKTTSRVLSRIPDGSDYRPDPRSRTAREIAWQIVNEEKMIIDALENGTAEWVPAEPPATMKEMCGIYDRQSAGAIRRLQALPASRWDGTLVFLEVNVPHPRWPGAFYSISFIIADRSRPICVRWGPRFRRSTVPARTSRNEEQMPSPRSSR